MDEVGPRELEWIESSRKDMQALPVHVRRIFGYALYAAQLGETPPGAKPLKGFGGAGRASYTVRFASKVYVLHVFQKKSKRGVATPKQELDLIRNRLKLAEALYTGRGREA